VNVLLLYVDGSVYQAEVDLTRRDVLREILAGATIETIEIPDLGISMLVDGTALVEGLGLNPWATALLYGAGRRPAHPVAGDAILTGLTVDGEPTDAPDDLVGLF